MPSPSANPKTGSQFDTALDLLAKARYDDARAAFRNFADNNPADELTPQAVYWVGDIAYVQKDYASAARAFAEQIKKYPTSTRAPDSMLKLGQSLIAMGQTKEGCMTLGALLVEISKRVESHQRASCDRTQSVLPLKRPVRSPRALPRQWRGTRRRGPAL